MSKFSGSFEDLIVRFPDHLLAGVQAGRGAGLSPRFPRLPRFTRSPVLTICGMGGSALPGLLLRDSLRNDARLSKPDLRLLVHRDYGLPPEAKRGNAIIAVVSYSGNTEETLSSYRETRRRRLPVAVIASGGTLARWAERDRVPFARIAQGLPPRFAIGLQLGALVGLTANTGFLPRTSLRDLRATAATLKPLSSKTRGRAIARRLQGRIPLIYASERNAALAYIWKIQINENAKVPAFTNALPELNHNEFDAYALLTSPQRRFHRHLAVVMLEDPADHPRVKKRMRVTASFLRRADIPIVPVRLRGRAWFAKTLDGLLLGQWNASFLAESYRVDPLPVDLVEEFKKRLKEGLKVLRTKT